MLGCKGKGQMSDVGCRMSGGIKADGWNKNNAGMPRNREKKLMVICYWLFVPLRDVIC